MINKYNLLTVKSFRDKLDMLIKKEYIKEEDYIIIGYQMDNGVDIGIVSENSVFIPSVAVITNKELNDGCIMFLSKNFTIKGEEK